MSCGNSQSQQEHYRIWLCSQKTGDEKNRLNLSLRDATLETRRLLNMNEDIHKRKFFLYPELKKVQAQLQDEGKDLGRPYFSKEERFGWGRG